MGFCSKVLVDQDKTQEPQKPTMNILAPLQPNPSSLSKTTLRQMNQIIIAMLSMTGRITMLGLSRWAGEGGSYRTIQRFYYTAIPWAQVFWQFFCQCLFRKEEVYILAGDECVVSKAGKKTYGLDRFFSGLQQKVIPEPIFLCSFAGQREPTTLLPVCHGANHAQRGRKSEPQSQKGGQKSQIR